MPSCRSDPTPAMLRGALEDAFGAATRFRATRPEGPVFTPASTAEGRGHASVVPHVDGSGYAADHDVPLNGAFSDLTARFAFRWCGTELHVALDDLHVM